MMRNINYLSLNLYVIVRSFCFDNKNISNPGFAALMLMGKEKLCDVDNLLLWAANKQMKLEGGFQVVFIRFIP